MGYLLAGGVASLILSFRPDTVGTSIFFLTETHARVAPLSGEIRHAC
ncbi:hypothetical protein [Sphingopyxis sp.]|jgi:hypothetical protein|nr:hypothetical protein [Sphingopyxis sp.]